MNSVVEVSKMQELAVRKFVAEFDPLGIGDCSPEDQYDDLVHKIISILHRTNLTFESKKETLIDIILEYADLPITHNKEVLTTVNEILFWWQNQSE